MRLAAKLANRHKIVDGAGFKLADHPCDSTGDIDSKTQAEDLLKRGVEWLSEAQEKLYAQDRWSLLLIFQAMDAAGKDGTIKHVLSGVNPQGCEVSSFKAPSEEELDHDFMWRCAKRLPERGRIGIFNRSYYEEVLVVRVHPEMLAAQKLPPGRVTGQTWTGRYETINGFERHLAQEGYLVRKFFLHVSKEEQRKRLLARLEDPAKNWKFSLRDVEERRHWGDYMRAYEQAIRATATEHAPWYVVPADKKWYTRLVVAAAIVDALDDLALGFPRVDARKRRELREVEAALRKNR